jgi:RTX calcium-binding nonapeptide repeat (4 copies)
LDGLVGLTHGRWSVRAILVVVASVVAIAAAQAGTVIRSPLVAGSPSEPPGAKPCPDRRYDRAFVRTGTRRADRIRGGQQGELVLAGAGADRVFAGGGNDCVDGGPGRDRLSGGSGDDILSGGTGHDILSGGTNDDVLLGDSGPDVLSGGAGDDLLIAGPGRDRLDCGNGHRDVARVERGDRVRRCERIVRGR